MTWYQYPFPPPTIYRLKVNGQLVTAWAASAVTPVPTGTYGPNVWRRAIPTEVPVPDHSDVRLLGCTTALLSDCSDDSNPYQWPTPTPTPGLTSTPIPTLTTAITPRPTPAAILNIEHN